MKTSYLLILFVLIAILLLTLLPQREGFKTPPLSAEDSMKQVKEGTKTLGSDGYRRSLNDRVGSLEQRYPDIPEDE